MSFKLERTHKYGNDPIWVGEYSPNQTEYLTADNVGKLIIWNSKDGKEKRRFTFPKGIIYGTYFPNGKKIIACSFDGTVYILDAINGGIIRKDNHHSKLINCVALSKDLKYYVGVGATIIVVELETGKLVKNFQGHDISTIYWVRYANDGNSFLTCSKDKTVRQWDAMNYSELTKFESDYEIIMFDIDYSGSKIAYGGGSSLHIWDFKKKIKLHQIEGIKPMTIRFDRATEFLFVGQKDNPTKIYDVQSAVEILEMDDKSAYYVYHSKDKKKLIMTYADGNIKVYDFTTKTFHYTMYDLKQKIGRDKFEQAERKAKERSELELRKEEERIDNLPKCQYCGANKEGSGPCNICGLD
jgi:WD40 repeat protein